ncbi:glycosyltransferase family 9 protein [Bradyrhizobium elkanii]|uniref:glycosyltransferase family 9 protein n=1 Tax=Bradyrhizobium elkanii TaxID=29448 RepID=UPI00222628E5|nr:hypothetical protein [Bradyrhizobium elkanii]MCW2167839.1 hypothetical protein [Bradyrhizobium elkanii]
MEVLQCDPPPWKPDYVCALLAAPMFMAGANSGTAQDLIGELAAARGLQIAYSSGGGCRDRYLTPKAVQPAPHRIGFNIGICWASGGGNQQFARRKSIPLRKLAPLARPGVNLISLQLEHNDDLQELGIIDAMVGVSDFADTAGVVDQLDLVITVDTAIAHLAGALGKPVWNLVRSDATSVWPWFWDMGATPWYSSMALYRQARQGDWGDPLKTMFADLDRLLADSPQRRRPGQRVAARLGAAIDWGGVRSDCSGAGHHSSAEALTGMGVAGRRLRRNRLQPGAEDATYHEGDISATDLNALS